MTGGVHASVLLFGLAEVVTSLGNWMSQMAVFSLLIFRGGGTVEQSTGILLSSLVAAGLASPLAGSLCDRFDRKILVIAGYLLSSLVVMGLLVAREPRQIYLCLAVLGALSSIVIPARQSTLRDILSPKELAKSNAFLQLLASLVKIAGPVVGGLLVLRIEPRVAIRLNVASYLIGAAMLMWLPSSRPRRASSLAKEHPRRLCGTASLASIRIAYRSFPLVGTFIPMVLCLAATMMVFDATASIIVRDLLQAGEGLLGILVSLIGCGSLVSSTLLAFRKHAGDPWHDLIKGQILLVAIPISVVIVPWLSLEMGRVVVSVLCFVGGLGSGFTAVQTLTLLQLMVPKDYVGRINGIYQSGIAVSQFVAAMLTPMLIPAYLSIPTAFGALTLVMLVLLARVIFKVGKWHTSTMEGSGYKGAGLRHSIE